MHVSGTFSYIGDWANYKIVEAGAGAGFTLENLLVEGRERTNPNAIKAVLNVEKGDPLLILNPAEAKAMLERLSWVESAEVQRRLPDTIYVRLTERKPLALWQHNKKLSLIDMDGKIIREKNLKPFKDLIVVTGVEAPAQAAALIGNLRAEPLIFERTEGAMLISGRRWDLKLDDGKMIKLPEDDMGYALRRLATLHEKDYVLDRNVISFDLRKSDRIAIQSHPDAGEGKTDASYKQEGKI